VTWHDNKWRASYHIVSFSTIEEAVEARKKKELELIENNDNN